MNIINTNCELLFKLIDKSSDIFLLYDNNFRILQWNKEAEAFLNESDLKGKQIHELDTCLFATSAESKNARDLLVQDFESYESISYRKIFNPEIAHREIYCPLQENGVISAILCTITEEIADGISHKSMFEALLDSTPSHTYFKDAESKFIYVNKAFCKRFGFSSPEEVLHKSDEDIFAEQDSSRKLADEMRIMQTGEPIIWLEESSISKDGQESWCETSKFPLYGPNKEVVGTFGMSSDITDRKILQRDILHKNKDIEEALLKLKEAKEEVERAYRAKNDFFANVSHEMKTPLNSILGMINMVLETDLDDKQTMLLETSKISSDTLLGLINDLLDVSQFDKKQYKAESVSFDLAKLMGQIANKFEDVADRKGIRFKKKISADIPKKVYGNSKRLEQVVYNILDNAIKFNKPNGEVLFELFPATRLAGGNNLILNFKVTDTGVGIASDAQRKIFDSFSKTESFSEKVQEGIGLGLTIVKKLVNLMKGEVEVESELGKGSTFSFYVVMKEEKKVPKEVDVKPQAVQVVAEKKALIVDDNILNLKVAEHSVKKLGFVVTTASNGLKALQKLEQSDFDFVLMDVQMPEMDGLRATRSIRNGKHDVKNKDIPIVAYTAHESKENCLDAGMNDYISKPFDINQLKKILESLSVLT